MKMLALKGNEILDRFHEGRAILLELANWSRVAECDYVVIDDIPYKLGQASFGRSRVLVDLLRKE